MSPPSPIFGGDDLRLRGILELLEVAIKIAYLTFKSADREREHHICGGRIFQQNLMFNLGVPEADWLVEGMELDVACQTSLYKAVDGDQIIIGYLIQVVARKLFNSISIAIRANYLPERYRLAQ